MDMNRPGRARKISFAFTAVMLAAAAGCMLAMVILTARRAAVEEGVRRAYFWRLAWVSAAVMGLFLILLAWVSVRHIRQKLAPERRHAPTPYVDAWAESGRRMKLEDVDEALLEENEEEEEKKEDEDEDDERDEDRA